MSRLVRMVEVESVLDGVLKIRWEDGHEGLVDLRPVFAEGPAFAFLRANKRPFAAVKLDPTGHRLYWIDPDGGEIDFGSDSLRRRAERQAAILQLAS